MLEVGHIRVSGVAGGLATGPVDRPVCSGGPRPATLGGTPRFTRSAQPPRFMKATLLAPGDLKVAFMDLERGQP